MATKAPTIGSLIDAMSKLRDQRRALAKQDEALKAQYDLTEEQLIEAMDKGDQLKATGHTASASISENIVFNTVDWNVFMAYLIKTKQAHLVQRRISAPAVLELFTSKGTVPGLEPFKKRGINLRNLAGAE